MLEKLLQFAVAFSGQISLVSFHETLATYFSLLHFLSVIYKYRQDSMHRLLQSIK